MSCGFGLMLYICLFNTAVICLKVFLQTVNIVSRFTSADNYDSVYEPCVFVITRRALLVCSTSLALRISLETVLNSSVSTTQMNLFISTSTSTSSSSSRRSIVGKAFAGPTLNSMTTLHVWNCSTRSRLDCFIYLMKNASKLSL